MNTVRHCRDRRSRAWHEAGHAIVAHLLAKRAPHIVTVEPDDSMVGVAAFTAWSSRARPPGEDDEPVRPVHTPVDAMVHVANVLVSAAGPACDRLLGLPEPLVLQRGRYDLRHVRDLLEPVAAAVGEHTRALEIWLLRIAERALRLCWRHVRRVAVALDRLGTLRRPELDRLLAGLDPTLEAELLLVRAASGLARRVTADAELPAAACSLPSEP